MKKYRMIPLLFFAPLIMGFFYGFFQEHPFSELYPDVHPDQRLGHASYQRVSQSISNPGLIWVKAYPASRAPYNQYFRPVAPPSPSKNHPAPPESNATKATPLPSELTTFIQSVTNGQPESITGLYAEGILALHVVTQPQGEAGFVSQEDGTATLFQSALPFGVTGLLAHNFLSGKSFYSLHKGQKLTVVYGDGSIQAYQIDQIADFQRLNELDQRSDFQDLQTGQTITSSEVFVRFYQGDPHLTLQTCLEKDGDLNWGVRFILAEPIPANP